MEVHQVTRVVIGMDPHKRSVTIAVMGSDEQVLDGDRYATDESGYAAMLRHVRQWPERVWAIEGCSGIGRHVATRLLADGEQVVDLPPKLSARVRMFSTGQGARPTPPTRTPSHSSAPGWPGCARSSTTSSSPSCASWPTDAARSVRTTPAWSPSCTTCCSSSSPVGAKKGLSAAQAKALLAKVRPRDAAGKTRRRVAAELITDLERIYSRKKAADKELRELVEQTGTSLMTLNGIGPSGAARLLIDVGDITRFPTKGHFASWNGTAPLDASSGDRVRHRLSRAGNRQINRTLHIMATVQLRNPTEGRAYYDRKKASGKTSMEAMRSLKRRLSDIVYRTMVDDAMRAMTGPGGHRGTSTKSSVAGSHPHTGSSDSHFPDPPPPSLRPPPSRVLTQRGAMCGCSRPRPHRRK